MTLPDFRREATERFDEMVARRRDLHQYPELGFEETRTSRIVAERLTELGLEVQTGLGQTGVVGLLLILSVLVPNWLQAIRARLNRRALVNQNIS